jgi:multidrug efflux system membrane fusion protein
MASRVFRPSRLIAVALVIGAVAWIWSGALSPRAEEAAEAAKGAVASIPVQKVGVTAATPEQHARQIVLSCITRADHRATATARGAGVLVDLRISRGSKVRAGETVALISDEGRSANVEQARKLLEQRTQDYESQKRLIDRGDLPRNQLAALDQAVSSARAALIAAQAEAERSNVTSPIDGVVDTVPVQIGQAVQVGAEIAEVVDPNPMLAVGAVSEARRGSLEAGQPTEVRFIDGRKVAGKVNFVGLSADKATRTYPVEATMDNADGVIADGVTCEMVVTLAPIEAASVPRSSLVFSDDGHLGIRIVDSESKAQFLPVDLVDDGRESVWVTGVKQPSRVIVVGQDFVKDGDPVEAVSAAEAEAKEQPPA